MASSKEYIDFILDQCSGLSARAMMGDSQTIQERIEGYI